MDALSNLKTSLLMEQAQAQANSDSQPTVQDLNRLLILQRDLLEKITLNLPLKALVDGLCLGSCPDRAF